MSPTNFLNIISNVSLNLFFSTSVALLVDAVNTTDRKFPFNINIPMSYVIVVVLPVPAYPNNEKYY